jgi:hypothetical protein
MQIVKDLSIKELRAAAADWRKYSINTATTLHDRIDELINEIERLRNTKPT